jgi:threonine dehydrogenase-like Zn-dependent dehydrogenase
MVDVAFDITGFPTVLASTTKMVRKLRRVLLLGDSPTPSKQSLGPRCCGQQRCDLGHTWLYVPRDRYAMEHVDSGKHDFSIFRLCSKRKDECEKLDHA